MKRQVRIGLCALLVSVCCGNAAAGQTPATWNELVGMVSAERVRDAADVELLRWMSAELVSVSPTFRQLLEALKAAPHMHLRAMPVAERRVLGRGYFTVAGAFTVGLMEITVFRRDPHLQVRAIAHELAHATEIACLPLQVDTAALNRRLMARAGHQGVMKSHGIETPFALAAERVVHKEYLGHGTPGGQLHNLAVTYELPLCQDGFPSGLPLRAELSQGVR